MASAGIKINLAPPIDNKLCTKCFIEKPDSFAFYGRYGGKRYANRCVMKRICLECEKRQFITNRSNLSKKTPCKIRGCLSGAATKLHSLCDAHMRRLIKRGSVDEAIPVRKFGVKKGYGYVDWNGYKRVRFKRGSGETSSIGEHRIVMQLHLGRELLPHENVHHKNGNRLDNRLENLELWTKVQPQGKRATDMVRYAYEILGLYEADYKAGVLGDG